MQAEFNQYLKLIREQLRRVIKHKEAGKNKLNSALATNNSEGELIELLWHRKDWNALIKVSASDVTSTPNCAIDALMVAIAHAKLNNLEKYFYFTQIAIKHQISTATMANLIGESFELTEKVNLTPKILSALEVGSGWSSNTINTAIYRHHGIITVGPYQFTAFYSSETTIIVIRITKDKSIDSCKLEGNYRLKDAHNSISLGFDKDHHLHITYDHHGTKLKYRRTNSPYGIESWGPESAMTGMHEDRVTYPTFINPRHGHPLTLIYRDGQWDKGCARIKTFDETKAQWQDHPLPILSGEENYPWSCNAYWNHPAVGKDGSLHLSFVWRTHSIGPELKVNNINVCYARSFDNGLTWQTSRGDNYKTPITPVNSETVFAVSPASNLMNQCSMALDSHDLPHIVFYTNDQNDIPQYFHVWQTQSGWKARQLTFRDTAFQLQGAGTLKLPISRPEIVIDSKDNAHIIFRADISQNRMAVISTQPPRYEVMPNDHNIIWPEDIGYSEPVIDRTNWERNKVLTIFLQQTDQPCGDVSVKPAYSRVTLIDVEIN